ncbi:MAG: putative metal-dependent hydrolase, partial [bacterium]
MARLVILLILAIFCFATIGTSNSKPTSSVQNNKTDKADKADKADVVFNNGNIYTVSDKQSKAEAIAVKDSKIIFVGTNEQVKSYMNSGTQVVDLKGSTVVPGMTDAHYHLSGVGDREVRLNLEGVASLSEMLVKRKAEVDRTPAGKWIVGRGWIETFWQPPVFPTSEDLDKVSPNNPVFLDRADGHGAVVNSQALKIAGIDKKTSNPFGGEISRDKETGKATGMLLDSAQLLVTKNIPAQTEDE